MSERIGVSVARPACKQSAWKTTLYRLGSCGRRQTALHMRHLPARSQQAQNNHGLRSRSTTRTQQSLTALRMLPGRRRSRLTLGFVACQKARKGQWCLPGSCKPQLVLVTNMVQMGTGTIMAPRVRRLNVRRVDRAGDSCTDRSAHVRHVWQPLQWHYMPVCDACDPAPGNQDAQQGACGAARHNPGISLRSRSESWECLPIGWYWRQSWRQSRAWRGDAARMRTLDSG